MKGEGDGVFDQAFREQELPMPSAWFRRDRANETTAHLATLKEKFAS